jgi:hypothetical protein
MNLLMKAGIEDARTRHTTTALEFAILNAIRNSTGEW